MRGIMTRHIERAGLRLAYDDSGGERPVAVLIHGWISERADLRGGGAALAPTYRVGGIDAAALRGGRHRRRGPRRERGAGPGGRGGAARDTGAGGRRRRALRPPGCLGRV